jgi:hypothetical protein
MQMASCCLRLFLFPSLLPYGENNFSLTNPLQQ